MWRFVQVSDPHLASARDGQWNNRFLCTMMPDVMECLRRDLARDKPDFILATGDIVSNQTRAAMFEARDLMDALDVPYFPMGGNHDFVLEDSRAWFLEAFAHRLPEQSTFYAFEHKNLRFCVLDAWWVWGDGTLSQISEASVAAELDDNLAFARWAIPPHQLTWLDERLGEVTDKPTIIALHYPLTPIPARMRRPEIRDGGCLENGKVLLDLLQDHPHVRAVFAGHVHLHFIEELGGLTQVVTGALPEFPTEYRDVHVYDDRLELYTVALSDPGFAERSLIRGKDWTAGEERDRRATIPLR